MTSRFAREMDRLRAARLTVGQLEANVATYRTATNESNVAWRGACQVELEARDAFAPTVSGWPS